MPNERGKEVIAAFQEDEELYDELEAAIAMSAADYEQAIKDATEELLTSLMTNEAGFVKNINHNQRALEQAMNRLEPMFEEAGMEDMLREIEQTYQQRLDTLNQLVIAIGLTEAELTDTDFETLPEIEERIDSVAERVTQGMPIIADEVRGKIDQFRKRLAQNQDVAYRELVDAIQDATDTLPHYARTIANTELAAIDRQSRDLQADRAGIQNFKYLGPDDELTRPWCDDHLREVHSRRYWMTVDNHAGPQPPMFFGGGWNCRHRLLMWKDSWGE